MWWQPNWRLLDSIARHRFVSAWPQTIKRDKKLIWGDGKAVFGYFLEMWLSSGKFKLPITIKAVKFVYSDWQWRKINNPVLGRGRTNHAQKQDWIMILTIEPQNTELEGSHKDHWVWLLVLQRTTPAIPSCAWVLSKWAPRRLSHPVRLDAMTTAMVSWVV